jgi:asparagine synthase (glutamine-hydrolysing)
MCAFAGIVAWEDRFRTDRETLRRMSARIAHRGPDGEGIWLNHEAEVTPGRPQCGLAFRRLAVLDPDPRAMQPFTIGHKTLVFNGEIYNFRELRAELTTLRPDYEWRTTGDTEVLLLAYDVWAEQCVERLNGMFAFAVWDEEAKSLFLARDRMGQKPLFFAFADENQAIAFASELPALLAVPWVSQQMDHTALHDYLRWGCFLETFTIYTGVYSFPPACTLSGQFARWSGPKPYFSPNPLLSDGPHAARSVVETRRLVSRAVERQLVSDVPLGCFLSGGVDSSVMAACCTKAASDVQTFSIGFDDPRYDEREYASAVAQHLGTRHHQFTVRPNAAEDLPKLATVFGEPFGDSSALPTHYLSRETRRHVKVALSGDGGDELFGGYDRYRAAALGRRLGKLPRPMRVLLQASGQRLPGTQPKSMSARVKRFVATLDRPSGARYSGYLRLFDDGMIVDLLREDVRSCVLKDFDSVALDYERHVINGRDPVQAALATDRDNYLPEDLLTKVDRASMLHSLEVRSPFMDHELVTFAAGLTIDQLLKGGPKRMLREAFADDLPPWVFKRRKMGFAVPIGDWFRGELRPMLRDHLFAADSFARQHFQMKVVQRLLDEHESQRQDHSQRLYALLMLELWWRL